jgi:hypothetical protein
MPAPMQEIAEFKTSLADELRKIKLMPSKVRANNFAQLYERRNLALIIYLLAYNSGGIINVSNLRRLNSGFNLDEYFEQWESFIEREFVDFDETRMVRFYDEFYKAIGEVYNDSEFNFKVLEPIPYFSRVDHPRGISAGLFWTWVNQLSTTTRLSDYELTELIATGFVQLAPKFIEYRIRKWGPQHIPVSVIQQKEKSEEWTILLTVHSTHGTIDQTSAMTSMVALQSVRVDYPKSKMLLIAPTIGSRDLLSLFNAVPNLYHVWDVSVPKLFHLMKSRIDPLYPDKQELVQKLDAILPPDPGGAFSADEAIARLEAKKNAKA